MEKIHLTITGMDYYEDLASFELGEIIRLKKEPTNYHDPEAIKAEIPFTGKIGYVANSIKTVAKGTMSAGRIYDKIEEISYAKIVFITNKELICEFFDVKKSGKEIKAIESLFEKWDLEKPKEDRYNSIIDEKLILNEEQEFDKDVEEHIFGIGLEKESYNKLPPAIKNKLINLIINTMQSKDIEPLEFNLFAEDIDINSSKFIVSKLKETDELMDVNNKSKICHDEIDIFIYKKEELINKYFEIKEKILDINDSINYKITNKEVHFYYDDMFFASMFIDDEFVSIAITNGDELEIENIEKTSYTIKKLKNIIYMNIKEEDKTEKLIKVIKEVLECMKV
jgi:hypothetical protein